jgi:hypothetical protein
MGSGNSISSGNEMCALWLQKESLMKTSKIAGLIIAGMLAVAPAALAGGFGDIGLPGSRSSNGDQVTTQELKEKPSGLANFYAPVDQAGGRHWSIRLDWRDFPFFTLISK